MNEFVINPEFRDKIPPLTADEFKRLEENIVADGEVREPLIVWNNTLIDGHHRWQIIQKHPEIPYKVKEMDFADKWGAISWMCSNQLGRRNATNEQKTYLLGKLYEARKKTIGAPIDNSNASKQCAQNEHIEKDGNRTAAIIAKEQEVGRETVKRAEHYAKGLDAAEDVCPGVMKKVLSGEVKVPKSTIAEIRNMPEKEKAELVKSIDNGTYKREIAKPVDSEEIKEIEAQIAVTNDTNRDVDYTADDLIREIEDEAEKFIKDLRRTFSIRIDIAKENIDLVNKVIGEIATKIYESKELLK